MFSLCHEACNTSRDCPSGQTCVSVGSNNVCELPGESTCSATSPCPLGLVCETDLSCRNACTAEQPCLVAGQTFHSLHVRNYRLWFTAQLISVSGTWMQTVAQAFLVLHLAPSGRSGIYLGLVTALQFLPMLLFGTWGGLIADAIAILSSVDPVLGEVDR